MRSRSCRFSNEPSSGLAGRVLHLNDEFAFLVLRFRGRGNACQLVIGKTGQIFLAIDHDRGCVLFLQNILLELGLQSCQLGIDFLQLFLVGIGELRSRAHEILVVTFEQIGRFRIESELIALLIKRLDSREQLSDSKKSRHGARQVSAPFLCRSSAGSDLYRRR